MSAVRLPKRVAEAPASSSRFAHHRTIEPVRGLLQLASIAAVVVTVWAYGAWAGFSNDWTGFLPQLAGALAGPIFAAVVHPLRVFYAPVVAVVGIIYGRRLDSVLFDGAPTFTAAVVLLGIGLALWRWWVIHGSHRSNDRAGSDHSS